VAKKGALTVTLRAEGVNETLRAFRGLPKEASEQLREAAQELSRDLAVDARGAGTREGHQAALVATTVKAARDRVPVVTAGGTKRLGSRRKPAWKLLFGAEFGSNQFSQFPRYHQGTEGVWFFPTIERNTSTIAKRWLAAADGVIRAFTKQEG
jgi:hypothetical protein